VTTIEAGGIRLNVERLSGAPTPAPGPPQTVVLVHGIATDNLTSYYFTIAPALAAAGHDVVMYDQRGHGRSSRPPRGYGVEDFSGDLDALLDALALEGPVHLIGNSFGGTVALAYALRRPERVAGILMLESEPPTAAWAKKMSGILAGSAHQLHDERTLPWIEETYGRHEARLVRWATRLLHGTSIAEDIVSCPVPAEESWQSLHVPVCAVYGATSDLADTAPWLESLLPRCRTVTVPGHGHSVLVGTPETVVPLLLDWLRDGHRELVAQ